MLTGPPGPLPHGTVLIAEAIVDACGNDGPMADAEIADDLVRRGRRPSSRGRQRDRLTGTFTPLKLSRVGAANTHTAQTMVKPTATRGTMMASPAGIRAR